MQKKLVITFVTLLLVIFAGFFTLPMLISKDAVKSQITSSFKLATGLDLLIQGNADLEAFPLPHVIIRDAYVPNVPTASTPFLLTVKTIDVRPTFASLFGHNLVIGTLNANGVDVELERLKDGHMNWRDATLQNTQNPVNQEAANAVFNASSIIVNNVNIQFTDDITETVTEYEKIHASLTNGGAAEQSSLKMNLMFKDRPFIITGHVGNIPRALIEGSVPAHLSVTSANSHFQYEGEVGFKNGTYLVKGHAELTTDDIVPWIILATGGTVKAAAPAADFKPLPLAVKSDITTENGAIIFPNLTLDGAAMKGGVQLELTLPYKAQIKADISDLDLETLFDTRLMEANKAVAAQAAKDIPDPVNTLNAPSNKSLWNSLDVDAEITVADTVYNHQHIKNAHIDFDMEDGEISVPQASALFPGESRIVFTGIGREGYQGITVEGQVDAAGVNFEDMIKVFKPKGFSIPPEDFKRFRIKTNVVMSAKEARFSELAARIENMGFVGGVIATFGDRTRLQAALRIGGVNLDHFITLWGLKEWEASFVEDTPGQKNEEFLSRWLKLLGYDLQVSASLEQFTLNNKLNEKTDFKLQATPGRISLPDFKTFYNGSTLAGSIAIDVTGAVPRIDMDVAADVLDTDAFFGADAKPDQATIKAPGEVWSHKGFDFHLLELFNSTYHLKFGRFKDGDLEALGLDMKGNINNRIMTVDDLSAEVLGAQIKGKGTLAGGKIPALQVAGTVSDISADRLTRFLPVLVGMNGKYNFNVRMDTSGIDMYTWISNLNGVIGMAGRDVVVHGFNLPGIVKAVSYVRTVANILDVVKRAFPGGDTTFSRLEGRWTITNGLAAAPEIRLSHPDSDVLLACNVDLINWKINGQITFALKALDASRPPSMVLNLTGNLDSPDKSLDTRQLEEYVTSKTSERMLQQYGNH